MIEIAAIILSPIFAVLVGQVLADRKEQTRRRHEVFQTLWLTRGDISPSGRKSRPHVSALNAIALEFSAVAVLDAWHRYHEALHEQLEETEGPRALLFYRRRDRLFADLLFEMSVELGYSISRNEIMRGSYAPQASVDVDYEEMMLRRATIELVQGKRALRIAPEVSAVPEPRRAATVVQPVASSHRRPDHLLPSTRAGRPDRAASRLH